jgi:hypothetical protein
MTAYELDRFLRNAHRSMKYSALEEQRRVSAKEFFTDLIHQLKTNDVAVVKRGDEEVTYTREQVREALLQS